jgi:hypothetical protein
VVEATGGDAFRRFSRIAAVAFFLVAIYTVVVKVPSGEFGNDWAHTVLHFATGLCAVYAGWIAAPEVAAALTWTLAAAYAVLGLVGWFVDGLFLDAAIRIPLAAADNVFHLLLGVAAVVTIVVARAPARGIAAPLSSPERTATSGREESQRGGTTSTT